MAKLKKVVRTPVGRGELTEEGARYVLQLDRIRQLCRSPFSARERYQVCRCPDEPKDYLRVGSRIVYYYSRSICSVYAGYEFQLDEEKLLREVQREGTGRGEQLEVLLTGVAFWGTFDWGRQREGDVSLEVLCKWRKGDAIASGFRRWEEEADYYLHSMLLPQPTAEKQYIKLTLTDPLAPDDDEEDEDEAVLNVRQWDLSRHVEAKVLARAALERYQMGNHPGEEFLQRVVYPPVSGLVRSVAWYAERRLLERRGGVAW